jgi:hypothetical protein
MNKSRKLLINKRRDSLRIDLRFWWPTHKFEVKKVTALEFLISMRSALPMSKEAGKDPKIASNSEIRRWLRDSAVVLNGVKVKIDDVVKFPVISLIFFPKSKESKCTLW